MKPLKKINFKAGGETWEYDPADLEMNPKNRGQWNLVLAQIPQRAAYYGRAQAAAEKEVSRRESEFEFWKSKILNGLDPSEPHFKSEAKRTAHIRTAHAKEWEKQEGLLMDARMNAAAAKHWSKAMDKMADMAQTVSANMRQDAELAART